MPGNENIPTESTPKQQIEGIGASIRSWADNIEGINTGKKPTEANRSAILTKVEASEEGTLDEAQKEAIEQIKVMDFSTGIDTAAIKVLAERFSPPPETE